MEMDNYLINIDVLRMKNQLDAYKSQRKRKISSTTNQNLELHLNFSNDDIEPIKEENNEDENANKNAKQKHVVWLGGSSFSSSNAFKSMVHTRQEYMEKGPACCRFNPVFSF